MGKEFQGVVGADHRVTIPKWIRDDHGIEKGDVVVLELKKVIKRAVEKKGVMSSEKLSNSS